MKKILVVEDSLIIRGKFLEYLKTAGYETAAAENGKDALEKVQRERFDLIIMDLMMPVMDGFEAIRRIREIKSIPFIPIIVASGIDAPDDLKKALELGANEYIVKPVDGVAFSARVKAMLNLKDYYEKAMASERKYENLLQALPDVVYKLDMDGNFVFVNDSVRTLGYEPHELIGRHFSEFIHVEDVPLVSRSVVLPKYVGKATDGIVGATGRPPLLFDERRSMDRATRNLEIRLAPRNLDDEKKGSPCKTVTVTIAFSEVDSAGQYDSQSKKVIGTVGIIKDVTERKEAEKIQKRLLMELKTAREELEEANAGLKEKVKSLEKFQELTIGREERIVQLKKKIKELEARLEGKG
ncbi:MAG: response regulator [Nitrospinae bacterium]|nr:response regulator [Nitrospinota bacterium]